MWASSPVAELPAHRPRLLSPGPRCGSGQGGCGNGLEARGRLASPLHQLLIKGIPGMTEPCALRGGPACGTHAPHRRPLPHPPGSWGWIHGRTANPCHLQGPEIPLPGFQGDRLGVGGRWEPGPRLWSPRALTVTSANMPAQGPPPALALAHRPCPGVYWTSGRIRSWPALGEPPALDSSQHRGPAHHTRVPKGLCSSTQPHCVQARGAPHQPDGCPPGLTVWSGKAPRVMVPGPPRAARLGGVGNARRGSYVSLAEDGGRGLQAQNWRWSSPPVCPAVLKAGTLGIEGVTLGEMGARPWRWAQAPGPQTEPEGARSPREVCQRVEGLPEAGRPAGRQGGPR